MSGSIRFPAHLNGVFGLRPTAGAVPLRGHHPSWTPPPCYELLTVMGPMSRHAEDLGPALEAMRGAPLRPAEPPVRVAVFEEDGLGPVSAACRTAVREAASALAGDGLEVEEAVPPAQRESREVFDTIFLGELAAGLRPRLADRRERFGDRLGGMFDGLADVETSLEDYVGAQTRRLEIEYEVDEWQERYSLALCPVGPLTAFPVDEKVTEVEGEPTYSGGLLTLCTYASGARLPACAVPAGRDETGLPVGVQVIGRRGRDADVVELARRLERLLGGAVAPDH